MYVIVIVCNISVVFLRHSVHYSTASKMYANDIELHFVMYLSEHKPCQPGFSIACCLIIKV